MMHKNKYRHFLALLLVMGGLITTGCTTTSKNSLDGDEGIVGDLQQANSTEEFIRKGLHKQGLNPKYAEAVASTFPVAQVVAKEFSDLKQRIKDEGETKSLEGDIIEFTHNLYGSVMLEISKGPKVKVKILENIVKYPSLKALRKLCRRKQYRNISNHIKNKEGFDESFQYRRIMPKGRFSASRRKCYRELIQDIQGTQKTPVFSNAKAGQATESELAKIDKLYNRFFKAIGQEQVSYVDGLKSDASYLSERSYSKGWRHGSGVTAVAPPLVLLLLLAL